MAALRAAVFKLFAKNRWGHNMPPPPVRVLNDMRTNLKIVQIYKGTHKHCLVSKSSSLPWVGKGVGWIQQGTLNLLFETEMMELDATHILNHFHTLLV